MRPLSGKPLVQVIKSGKTAPSISFIGFAEAFLISRARDLKLSPRAIREGIRAIRSEYRIDYALANRLIYTDLADLGVKRGHHHERARDRQLQLTDAVKDYVSFFEFGSADDYPNQISLPRFSSTVIVSPYVASGHPIVKKTGVPVADILSRYAAKEPPAVLAYESGLPENEVLDLVHSASGSGKTGRAA